MISLKALSKFFAPKPNVHVIEPRVPELNEPAPTWLKTRKWVMWQGSDGKNSLGITVDLSGQGFAIIDLVSQTGENNGETYATVRVPIRELRLARSEEIPESRHPGHEVANKLGYM